MATPLVQIADLPTKAEVESGNWLVVDDGGTTKKIDIDLVNAGDEPIAAAHISDAVAAHAASAVSAIGGGGLLNSNTVQGQLDEADTAISAATAGLSAHIADTAAAHAATAVSATAPPNNTGTDVQAVLDSVAGIANNADTTAAAAQASLTAHANDTTAAHLASAVGNIPAGSISSTDVQGALNELGGDIQGHVGAATAHTAASIAFTPTGSVSSTNVQAAIAEMLAEGGVGGGGGSGTITSVNGQTGPVVVLTQDNVDPGVSYKQFSAVEQTKLAGIATGATANATDAALRDRALHTGAQPQSSITNLGTDLTAIKVARPVFVWYNTVAAAWPDPGVDSTIMVVWVSEVPGVSVPAAGARPLRQPHDIFMIPQAP